MPTYNLRELNISIIFIGMLLGLILADLLAFYPTSLIKASSYTLQALIAAFILFIGIYLFVQQHKKRNRQNLLAIINNTENLVWSVDKRFRYLAFNQAYEKMHQRIFKNSVKPGELIWNRQLKIDQVLQWKEFFNRSLQGEKFNVELDYSQQIGVPCFISISFNPIYEGDKHIAGVGCYLQNITQRILHEAEISKQNKQFKEIAFIISHSVRAPLSNILGLVEVIDDKEPLNEANKQIVASLKISAKQLDDVIRNVVDRTVKINSSLKNGLQEV